MVKIKLEVDASENVLQLDHQSSVYIPTILVIFFNRRSQTKIYQFSIVLGNIIPTLYNLLFRRSFLLLGT